MVESLSAIEPPYSLKVLFIKGCLRISVTLHKISPKLINFQPTSTRFYLDTFKGSKKYLLDFEYPGGVIVVTEPEPEAVFERGILRVDLVINDWRELTKKHDEVVETHAKKLLKIKEKRGKRSHPDPMVIEEPEETKKKKPKEKAWKEDQYISSIKAIVNKDPDIKFQRLWKQLEEKDGCQRSKSSIRQLVFHNSLLFSGKKKKKFTSKNKKLQNQEEKKSRLTKSQRKKKERKRKNSEQKKLAMDLIEGINLDEDKLAREKKQQAEEKQQKIDEFMENYKDQFLKKQLKKQKLNTSVDEEMERIKNERKERKKERQRVRKQKQNDQNGQKRVSFREP